MIAWARRIVYRHWQRFHGVRRLEVATLRRYLDLGDRDRVLDVGSGKGAFCGALSREGHPVVGVEPSLSALRIAKRYASPAAHFVIGEGERLGLADAQFDRAVSVCVLEHTRDDAAVLREVARVLKPGGIFALSVDSLSSPHVSEAFRRHHVREYRCNQLYDRARIGALLEAAGFETLATEYLFAGRLSVSLLRFGSRFHYRGPFILLFPLIYPLLLLDHARRRGEQGGMILAVKARKRADG
ncbi:MAG: class I SAM-dependent methyltransferase [Thermoanaerobaculia bacterium]